MRQFGLGELLAITAGLSWALGVVFFRRTGFSIRPLSLNLFKNCFAFVLLVLTMLFLGEEFFPDRPLKHYLLLFLSGGLGLALADFLFLESLNLVGAGYAAILECSYSPSVIFFGWILLGETLTLLDYLGGCLVILAILVVVEKRSSQNVTRWQWIKGIVLGILAMVLTGFGVVIAKPAFVDASLLWANVMRLVPGILCLVVLGYLFRSKTIWSCFRRGIHLKPAIIGSFFGTYIALLAWLGGMKFTSVGVAAILNQLSTIFILLFAVIFLNEAMTKRKLLAAGLAFVGTVLVCV